MTARAKAGCQACRVRHLKCDQKTPTCGRCESSGRECTRGYPYRYHQNKFDETQKWVTTPKHLSFVDQTEEIVSGYDGEDSEEIEAEDRSPSIPRPQSSASASQHPHFESPFSPPPHSHGSITLPPLLSITSFARTSPFLPPPVEPTGPPTSISNPFSLSGEDPQLPSPAPSSSHHDRRSIRAPSIYSNSIFPFDGVLETNNPPTIYLDKPVWPLKDPKEALLLRHFVQKLAIWLDLCDPMQHFQVEVPKRAGTCPILLNAIFALSARHLSHIGDYDDPLASNRYHQECLKYLIPMLDNNATVGDETLFAATIILRVLEEIDIPENDLQGHMLGIQVFVNARDPQSMLPGGLSEASFWVGLRQEIYSAMMAHKAIAINLSNSLVNRSLEATSDFGWANRAVVHCADVLNCCFGRDAVGVEEWRALQERSRGWKEGAPSSFEPIFYRERDATVGESFPEVWYSMSCHIIGVQHHRLGEILLSIFNPSIPKVGAGRMIGVRKMEEEIAQNLRYLCGIGLYNRWTAPGMFTASMGIAICGDRFTNRTDQQALLDVLVKTEQEHARPTALVQEQMKRSWGWDLG